MRDLAEERRANGAGDGVIIIMDNVEFDAPSTLYAALGAEYQRRVSARADDADIIPWLKVCVLPSCVISECNTPAVTPSSGRRADFDLGPHVQGLLTSKVYS